MNSQPAPLYGLVLAGGASRRMGQDKASLSLHGRPQLEWARELLARHCDRVFTSIRAGQHDDPLRSGQSVIVDTHDGAGPIAGIAAAQAAYPAHAWLVLACDLPFVDDACLETLVRHRDGRPVVAFASTHDGLPEPLCAIYEPASRAGVLDAITSGRNCPRKYIVGTGVVLVHQPAAGALENVNTPDELERAQGQLRPRAVSP
jgi:molybdopterin-guanine dinucleotide biosynthesis protein A